MGSFTVDMPEQDELMHEGGGNHLKTPGIHHLHIVSVDEQPVDKKGNAVDGFRVEFSVLGGPKAGQQAGLTFWSPKASDPDQKNWDQFKRAAFAVAAGLTHESKGGQQVTVELSDCVDRQVVAELSFDDRDADKPVSQKWLRLHYANIYHVDDPRASSCPKDAKALALLPKSQRRTAESFKAGKPNGQATSQPAGSVDVGDI